MVDLITPVTTGITAGAGPNARKAENPELWAMAQKLEAGFLSEMLKSAGFGEARESFGGGAGEDQFSSFLRDEHARGLVDNGGIGLAQSLFDALKERADGN